MQYTDLDRLRSIKTLPSLVAYLRDELDWPIDADAIEDVTFDYDPTELGFLAATAVHIKEVKQLRPLHANQPWGVFWINFEKKRLPVVMLRRALGHLAVKKRASANKAMQRAWHMHDLLFISACGEDHERAITFAHFSQDAESPGDLPILKVLGWDDGDTVLHIAEAHNTLVAKLHWPSHTADLAAWRDQWSSAFTVRHREVITTTEQLEAELAHLATRVRLYLGQILLEEGKPDAAAEIYQQVLDTTGEADANLGMVRVEIARRDASAVVAALNRAARARITPAEFLPLINGLTTVDDFGKAAVTECLKVYTERPGDLEPAVTWFCAQAAGELELQKEQTELLKATLELEPEGELLLDTLDKYGVSQLQDGDAKLAIRIFEQLLSQPGLAPGARVNTLFRLSIAYGINDDIGSARRAINEALQMVPNEPQLLARLALIEAEDGNFDKAESILIQAVGALEQTGNKELLIEARMRLAGIYMITEKWDSAAEQYETILEIDDVTKETRRLARMALSNVWTQSGEIKKGEAILEEIYRETPDDPGVNNDLGYLYADQGKNLEQAEKMIRIAVAAEGDNPAYLDSLGWVLFKQGKLTEALEYQKKANDVPDHEDSTLLEHQGDIHEALKQTAEARSLWQQALDVERKDKRPDKKVIERIEGKLKPAPK